jgi:hypothetical protein
MEIYQQGLSSSCILSCTDLRRCNSHSRDIPPTYSVRPLSPPLSHLLVRHLYRVSISFILSSFSSQLHLILNLLQLPSYALSFSLSGQPSPPHDPRRWATFSARGGRARRVSSGSHVFYDWIEI